jgi:hypothetical protein
MIAIMRGTTGAGASWHRPTVREPSVFIMHRVAVIIAVLAAASSALAQTMPHAMAGNHGAGGAAMPGQDAFGAIQEIVRILEADPWTDWSRVNLTALRAHLIDMNLVTLDAAADSRPVDNGLAVTGSGRTLAAIRRMVTAQATELNRLPGWTAAAESLPDGVLLTVTSTDPKEAAHIRGLGFIGLLASGSHHQRHHLAIALGEPLH